MASAPLPITAWQTEREEKVEIVTDFLILGSKITADGDCSHEIKRHLLLWKKPLIKINKFKLKKEKKKSYDKPRQCIKKQRHHFANKGPSSQSYGFSSSHVWLRELNHKEGWVPKNWCFWIVVLEKALESPLDCKEIKPVSSKGNQPWIFTGRTSGEVEAPILWPPDMKSWLIRKYPDARKDWRQKEKGKTEDEMAGWYYWLIGPEFEWAPGDGWRTGKPDMLQSLESQRVRHDLVTEQQHFKSKCFMTAG